MDSTENEGRSHVDEPYNPNEDNEITYLVNASIYKQWRSEYVDEIELSVWNIDMVKFAISTTFNNYGSIKTAIQRGVPDIIKHYIWIKANDADKFYIDNPSFYTDSYTSTFGDNVPTEMGDYCPTFSGGIFGFQADLIDSPLGIDQLHRQFDRSLESQVFNESDNEYNYWVNPYKEASPSARDSSSVSLSTKKSSRGILHFYYGLIRRFRQKPSYRKSDSSSSSDISKDDSKVTVNSQSRRESSFLDVCKPDEMESASSIYSIQVSDFSKGSKTGMGNKDRLIDYIHLLNHENANKRKLMKSALARIRKGSEEKKSFVRNVEKTRQMSDTFIYNTKYSYFPPPPSHHSKLMQSSVDVNASRNPDHPFYKRVSMKKSKSKVIVCFPFVCGSKRKNKLKSNVEKHKSEPVAEEGRYEERNSDDGAYYRDANRESYNMDSYRESDYNMYTPDTFSDYASEEGYRRHSDSAQQGYTYMPSMLNHLPVINTIPEHSASNSVVISYSRSCSNASNAEDDMPPFETHSNVESERREHEATAASEKMEIVSAPPNGSEAPSPVKTMELDVETIVDRSNLSKIYTKDMELITNLSKGFTKQMTSTSIDRSVYKLTDVTDFTVLLTDQGVLEVKRILWVLNSYFSTKIEFLPVIPSLCCLLLIYLSPNAVLCLLYRFMNKCVSSSNLNIGMRFFFVDRRGFVTFVTFVISVLVSHLKKTVEHLKNLRVDVAAWVARSIQTGFSQILPFDYIVRIYGNLLFEGEIVLCRYCVALIKCTRAKLLAATSKEAAEELLYHIGLDDSIQIDKLTKIAYSLRIKKVDKKIHEVDTPTPYLMNVKIRHFYRPRLSSSSSILSETHWEVIWAKLNAIYRILDPQNIYASYTHGATMTGLIKRVTECIKVSSPALLFIKTKKLEVFGVFIPNLLHSPIKGFFTPQEIVHQMNSFIFTFSPFKRLYEFTAKNATGVKFSTDSIIVGANGPAIIVDKTLSTGYTTKCESYDSPQLASSTYFDVYMIELWTLS
ncbi:uncharacterized protein TOT_040000461 [Theileria orientalis strain Shintoku]|uniref:TLDc domain-containing protein n=1 Tax=Theileria orientalis strain Shintoku TaxID=869250 RepID=J4DAM8_THEOR|nr:uncharacterized protein TOT_040000461 [Theileria orientalis strain Shintoku]BAM42085.1 uncharacterized protein TOT_040000461 [Theileria orientalis strain Shintoku]|eukprot:XP_009692386.1 uncharacterized protein TOT_040000461 [Theileria orientalis strain Shintoku]